MNSDNRGECASFLIIAIVIAAILIFFKSCSCTCAPRHTGAPHRTGTLRQENKDLLNIRPSHILSIVSQAKNQISKLREAINTTKCRIDMLKNRIKKYKSEYLNEAANRAERIMEEHVAILNKLDVNLRDIKDKLAVIEVQADFGSPKSASNQEELRKYLIESDELLIIYQQQGKGDITE